MLKVLLIIYVVGLLAGLCLLVLASRSEPTSHGQGIIWSLGSMAVVLWPIALGWSLVVGVLRGGAWAADKLRAR